MADRITKSDVTARLERVNNEYDENLILHHGYGGNFQIRKELENGGEAELSNYGNLRSVDNFIRALTQLNRGNLTKVVENE